MLKYIHYKKVLNIFKRQSETDEILKYCEDNDLTFLAYLPMGIVEENIKN